MKNFAIFVSLHCFGPQPCGLTVTLTAPLWPHVDLDHWRQAKMGSAELVVRVAQGKSEVSLWPLGRALP